MLILRCFCNNDLGHFLNSRTSFQKEVTEKRKRPGLRAWLPFEIPAVWSLKQDCEKKTKNKNCFQKALFQISVIGTEMWMGWGRGNKGRRMVGRTVARKEEIGNYLFSIQRIVFTPRRHLQISARKAGLC